MMVVGIISGLLSTAFSSEVPFVLFYGAYSLAILVPTLAVTVRRLHDIGKSGWMYFVGLIPLIGGIWLLVLLVTEGNHGPNQYGEDPKNAEKVF